MSAEDWDKVTVLRKKVTGPRTVKTTSELNAAQRAGAAIASEKRGGGKGPMDASKAAKIDRETEDFHVERVSLSVGKAIQQARQEKGLTQKDLATKINEKPTVVNDYESGKAANPNQQVLAKLERALGVKLRGKDIGSKLEPRGAKK